LEHLSIHAFQVVSTNKMFPDDGRNHHIGVANEHSTIDMVNTNPKLAPIREKLGFLVHKGGTQNNADAVGRDTGIKVSMKNKESISGSFDWKNMSLEHDEAVRDVHMNIIRYYRRFQEFPETEKEVRAMYKTLFNSVLGKLDTKEILGRVLDAHDSEWILIHFRTHRELILFHRDELAELWKNPGKCMVRPGCASGKIEGTPNLRMRVCLNNGIRALIGRGSSLCIKVQQDSPMKMIKELKTTIVCAY